MIKLSTKSRYAVRALIDLAIHYKNSPVLIKDIAKRQGVSERYLENIFTILRNAQVIGSVKGKGGGFTLEKPLEEISLLDIVQLMEGKVSIVDCVDRPETCDASDKCAARDEWVKISKQIRDSLLSVSLKILVERQKKKGAFRGSDI